MHFGNTSLQGKERKKEGKVTKPVIWQDFNVCKFDLDDWRLKYLQYLKYFNISTILNMTLKYFQYSKYFQYLKNFQHYILWSVLHIFGPYIISPCCLPLLWAV